MRNSNRNFIEKRRLAGLTLVEVMMSVAILSIMLSSIHAFNSQCVSVMRSKRNLGASSLLMQERVEAFRMANWATVTTSEGVSGLLANQTNSLEFGFMAIGSTVEKVTITAFDPATGTVSGPSITATRADGPVQMSGATNLSDSTAVRLDFEFSWQEMGRTVGPRKLSTTLGSFGFSRTTISRKPYLPKAPNS